MFEEFIPKHRVGFLSPLSVIDNAAYEFYKLAPPGMIAVMIPIGLGEFSPKDVERVFAPLEKILDKLMERGIDLVLQAGTPLPILIGVEAHDRLIARMAKYTGKPATSTVLSVTRAARHLGIKKIALVNKWSVAMNRTLGEFFAREGVEVGGAATKELAPSEFVKIAPDDHMQLAYELGRAALSRKSRLRRGLSRRRHLARRARSAQARAGIRQARDLQPDCANVGYSAHSRTTGGRSRAIIACSPRPERDLEPDAACPAPAFHRSATIGSVQFRKERAT